LISCCEQFSETISFSRYSETELIRIFQTRLGSNIVAKNALEYVSKKVSSNSGDVREAFEMVSQAIRLVQMEAKANESPELPLVTLRHVLKLNAQKSKLLSSVIDGLPMRGKAVLCTASALARENVQTTTLGHLKAFVDECVRETEEEFLSIEDFSLVIETLIDHGVLMCDEKLDQATAAQLHGQKITLGVQLEEVTNLLEKELQNNHSFYKRIYEAARVNKHRLSK